MQYVVRARVPQKRTRNVLYERLSCLGGRLSCHGGRGQVAFIHGNRGLHKRLQEAMPNRFQSWVGVKRERHMCEFFRILDIIFLHL